MSTCEIVSLADEFFLGGGGSMIRDAMAEVIFHSTVGTREDLSKYLSKERY